MPTTESVHNGAAAPGRPGPGAPGGGRVLLQAATAPLAVGYGGIAAMLALVTAAAPGAALSTGGVLRATGSGWLVVYHVPVTIHGHELGVLPLLPTIAVLALVARSAANTARRLEWDTPRSAAKVICVVGSAHAVFAAAIALLTGTSSPVVAFFVAGIAAAVAATAGTAAPCGLLAAVLDRADGTTLAGLRAAVLAMAGLTAVGAVVFGAGLLGSWPTAARTFQTEASGIGSGLGMFLLSVAYLPNALIGTLSFTAGPGFAIGRVSVAQWHFHAGPVPGVPVLAPLPATFAHWWPCLMMLPAGVGVLAGLLCRTSLRAVGVAALVTGTAWLVLAALAGGALADGPFDPVTVPAGLSGAAVFAFVAVPGALTTWLTGQTKAEAEAEPEDETEPAAEQE